MYKGCLLLEYVKLKLFKLDWIGLYVYVGIDYGMLKSINVGKDLVVQGVRVRMDLIYHFS